MQGFYSFYTDYFLPCLLEYDNTEIGVSIIFKPVAVIYIYIYIQDGNNRLQDRKKPKNPKWRHLNTFIQQILGAHYMSSTSQVWGIEAMTLVTESDNWYVDKR